MNRELSDTLDYMDLIEKKAHKKNLIDYPKTNIHFYLKTPQQKKKTEKVLVNIWKE